MGKHNARPRPGRMIPVLGTSCGLLAAAAFTGGIRPAVTLPEAGDTTVTVARGAAESASDAAPVLGGPLAIPEIGVVAPDFDERYAALSASQAAPAPAPAPTPTPAPPAQRPAPPPPEPSPPAPTSPPPSEEPNLTDDASPTPEPPPAETPRREEPPAEEPPAEEPPAEEPPAEEPPTEKPREEKPPAEAPLTEEPPAEEPPAEEPPVEEPPAEEPPAEEPPAEEPPAEEPPAEAPLEDVELALGETFDVEDHATGRLVYSIVVDSVVPDVACTAAGSLPAENGHFVGVHVRVISGPAPAEGSDQPAISASDFGFVGADSGPGAEADTASAEACVGDARDFPSAPLAPEQDVAGMIVLDVSDVTGAITFRPTAPTVSLIWRF
jgi:hypothetical protein